MQILFGRSHRLFSGTWDDRLSGIFEVGVDYSGKSILDLGCNMGVVAYEISKRNPAFIHGVEKSRKHIHVASMIFQGCPVESRFDRATIGSKSFISKLKPTYDIALMLAVFHYIHGRFGPDAAADLLRLVGARCSTIVLRDPGPTIEFVTNVLQSQGFRISNTFPAQPKAGSLTVYAR